VSLNRCRAAWVLAPHCAEITHLPIRPPYTSRETPTNSPAPASASDSVAIGPGGSPSRTFSFVISTRFVIPEFIQDAPCCLLSKSFFAYKFSDCAAINSRIARKFPDSNLFLELVNGFGAFCLNFFPFLPAVLSRFIKLARVLTIRRFAVHFFSDKPDFFHMNGVPTKQARGVFFARSQGILPSAGVISR
jgi:hypothetical protein